MTRKDLVRIIREVIKYEVRSIVKKELNEAKIVPSIKKTNKLSLTEALQQTKNNNSDEEWPTMGNFKSGMRSQFAAINGQNTITTDIKNRPIDTRKLDPSLNKALNRDYRELVKRF